MEDTFFAAVNWASDIRPTSARHSTIESIFFSSLIVWNRFPQWIMSELYTCFCNLVRIIAQYTGKGLLAGFKSRKIAELRGFIVLKQC